MTITFYRNTPFEDYRAMTSTVHPAPCPIVRAFGGATIGYECMACHRLWQIPEGPSWLSEISARDGALQNATQCCVHTWRCDKHDKELNRGWSCGECNKEQRAAKELAAYTRAEKIPLAEYNENFVYREGYGRDGFISVGDLDDIDATDPAADDPKWAFACYKNLVSESDADLTDHVAEGILADHHEDAYDWVDDDKVKEASRLIFEACKDVVSYMADESVVVIFEHKQESNAP